MYSARTLLVPVLLIGGLVEVVSAQHKYIFPQFAFGAGWESTLMVQALDGNMPTCTFSAQGRFLTMRNPFGNNLSGTSITLVFGMNGWTILKTATPQGMANVLLDHSGPHNIRDTIVVNRPKQIACRLFLDAPLNLASTSRSATRSASPKPGSNRRLEAGAIPMTTRWPSP